MSGSSDKLQTEFAEIPARIDPYLPDVFWQIRLEGHRKDNISPPDRSVRRNEGISSVIPPYEN